MRKIENLKKEYFHLFPGIRIFHGNISSKPVSNFIDIFVRDIKTVMGKEPVITDKIYTAEIIIRYNRAKLMIPESYKISFFKSEKSRTDTKMIIEGCDDLGIIYAILYISSKFLGIDPFWFWTDKKPRKRKNIKIPLKDMVSRKQYIRYRGWFVNDEVCLIGWTDRYPPPKEIWAHVYETLLRCGGNMVIPGTDLPRTGIHLKLALEMGLYITHHHAEPLGAEMFLRAYPDKIPDYMTNKILFTNLWEEAVIEYKDKNIIWTLSFRGQGDCPFWEHTKKKYTDREKGDIISRVMEEQINLIKKHMENPVCCTYLYGEIMKLYKDGYINFPDRVIKIWSDNGYGKMVSRRQGNHNPKIPSLPENRDNGSHGMYYHITFHDLQASNHLTMFPNTPEFMENEISGAFRKGIREFLLLNCGNIRPHVLFLSMVSELWRNGAIYTEKYLHDYCSRYYSKSIPEIKDCYREYFTCTLQYGKHKYDKAGEEFYHHNARKIISFWICNNSENPAEKLLWLAPGKTFSDQVTVILALLEPNLKKWINLKEKCTELLKILKKNSAQFFKSDFVFNVNMMLYGTLGLRYLCMSYFDFKDGKYPKSFVKASNSLKEYKKCINVFKDSEYGKWKNFYRGDWLTNIKSTVYSLETLRRFIRMHGDSPDFFLWSRSMLRSEAERGIFLENTHRKPLSDDELADKLSEYFTHHT